MKVAGSYAISLTEHGQAKQGSAQRDTMGAAVDKEDMRSYAHHESYLPKGDGPGESCGNCLHLTAVEMSHLTENCLCLFPPAP